jgi:alkanesulfonate monooxygenase SsuD/methylene tetrahydromethanopterin reductase-like flavin-dependent oxidoreductase (luciferase family)
MEIGLTAYDMEAADFVDVVAAADVARFGWLEEEFAALDVPFAERISRFEEAIAVLRVAWRGVRCGTPGGPSTSQASK